MTSEQIIQRLLDEKHITVKEALILLKDIAKNMISPIRKSYPIQSVEPEKFNNQIAVAYGVPLDVVAMYGVLTPYDNTTWVNS